MKRYIFSLFFIVCALVRVHAVGWLPVEGGLVVNLNQGDQILLSVWLDVNNNGVEDEGEEYFINNYNRYTGGRFNYGAGLYLKLIPQEEGVSAASTMSKWTVGAPLTRSDDINGSGGQGKHANFDPLGGTYYTIWNDGRTLRTQKPRSSDASNYQFVGNLTPDGVSGYDDQYSCDVVFVIPTARSTTTSFDPNKTLTTRYGRTDQDAQGRFNGKTGTGFLGMTYREVYMMVLPRYNAPVSYANTALVTFNTTTSTIPNNTWRNAGEVAPGKAAFAFADTDGRPYYHTTRTVFRLYILNDPINSCSSYFFATDEQDYRKYRTGPGGKQNLKWADSTDLTKSYTMDHLTCMSRVGSTQYYQTDLMYVPIPDSTYFYVGYNDDYKAAISGQTMGSGGSHSQFTKIRELPIFGLEDTLKAPAGACGRMVADTTSSVDNLDVKFKPAGFFLKVSPTGTNVQMRPNADSTIWTCEEMWHITDAYAAMQIKATTFSGPEFSATDEGKDIAGWSVNVVGTSVPLASDHSQHVDGDMDGWARIYANRSEPNGYMEFIMANPDHHIHYDNNKLLGNQVPDQYPEQGKTKVIVEEPRLVGGFNFTGWTRNPDGTGGTYHPGDEIDLKDEGTVLTLYAQGTYTGTYHVAFSFEHSNGKRYFLTQPVGSAVRYARARPVGNWTDTYQGMSDAYNTEPNYISTYKLLTGATDCPRCSPGEYVLDPCREMRHGAVDSLLFYENFAPDNEVYLGLYFDDRSTPFKDPVTIVANNTWAGLFTSKEGWPDYSVADVQNTKLKSEYYLHRVDGNITRDPRPSRDSSYVKYNEALDQFDGVETAEEATTFQISRVRVADEHYVVLPDTSHAWNDTIEFGYHHGEQVREQVWTSLIGKQLLAVTKVGDDTVYFHPNPDKIITNANDLYLSSDFRVSQYFTLIRDSRVSAALEEGDSVTTETTSNYWHNNIVSGLNSPIDVTDGEGHYIDIIDTFRITLSHGGISKIKEYYGLWKEGAPGLHVSASGMERTRNVIVRTKTYHYGPTHSHLELIPEFKEYSFNPMAGVSRTINFILRKVNTHRLVDVNDHSVGEEEIVSIDTITASLDLDPANCTFASTKASPGTYFSVSEADDHHVTLTTREINKTANNLDTLIISTTVTIEDVAYPASVRVPLVQTSLEGDELIWSVVSGTQRYYIMAGTGGLIFRKYNVSNSTLYKEGTTNGVLKKGSKDAENSDNQYITPWHFSYHPDNADQLALKIEYGVNRHFKMLGDATGSKADIHASDSSFLYYDYVDVYTNDNANEEELVKLQFGTKWLKFTQTGGSGAELVLVDTKEEGSVFSWSYLKREYNLYQKHGYPNRGGNTNNKVDSVTFDYNTNISVKIQSRYKAYKDFSMLVGNNVVYCCREDEETIANLVDPAKEWRTRYEIERIADARTFDSGSTPSPAVSGLSFSLSTTDLISTISTSSVKTSPRNVKIGGKYVNIVDTLHVKLSLQDGAPEYYFRNDWKDFKSIDDAELKIPLIRKTYHSANYDSLVCTVEGDEYNYTFPNTLPEGEPVSHTFTLGTLRRYGEFVLDVDNTQVATIDPHEVDVTVSGLMNLSNSAMAEIRLMDEFGHTPSWCEITGKTENTITVQCTEDGIRSPRTVYVYIVYIIMLDEMRIVTERLAISQPSVYQYANNQHLVHTSGASGDPLDVLGMQQVHENKRILYYYPDQDVELPVRDSHFFGWWRWFREGEGEIGDSDIPAEAWRQQPRNVDKKFNYPFRIIGDSVNDPENPGKKKLVTMGRYTVFHYRSKDYTDAKKDPPCKTVTVVPPVTEFGLATKPTYTYAVEISNYYDNLPMSASQKNQVDVNKLDTMTAIYEPTLSLREVFELRPWTEMAARMEGFKTTIGSGERADTSVVCPLADELYMEDHVMMAPLGNELLLSTEQRYKKENLAANKHSESLLGYYMRDDNWNEWSENKVRQDTMIWCGGWDANCQWYTYDPKTQKYSECTHSITTSDDFLQVPAKENIPAGKEFDTVYYCLRARSQKTTGTPGSTETTVDGDYMFNICRYKLIYHQPTKYGPLVENQGKALITNEEIAQNYEVLERLNFDYNQPGPEYTVYPHPLPWADASYGYTYPETPDLPHNRLHEHSDFPNHGEYGLINRIPEASHWGGNVTSYWRPIEQHGGAENGYMIYCDGMSSSGQVAALSLTTHLCAGQKMFFSGYVCNPSNQTGKSDPNFTFAVQGSVNGTDWEDITSYTTGGIKPSNPSKWSQIYFPIIFNEDIDYKHFRVRIYNVSSDWDGNDFIIDDMCIFATKPPLIAYQANTACKEKSEEETPSHMILRVDYQGITGEGYNDSTVCYTVKCDSAVGGTGFVHMLDDYLDEQTNPGKPGTTDPDTIYGRLFIPGKLYEPTDPDSIFVNMNELIDTFNVSNGVFKEGYIYEILEGDIRPVKYVVHSAYLNAKDTFTVHMSAAYKDMLSSICGMTSYLKVSNMMVLELNGEEVPDMAQNDLCANATYDIGLRVKGSLYLDSVAPINLNGTCVNDWLLYGDTAEATSEATYGYKYSDIVKVVKDILRCEPKGTTNANQFAKNMAAVSRDEMLRIQKAEKCTLSVETHPYDILTDLVDNGFLTLYQSSMTATVYSGDSIQYVIFPILGTGTDTKQHSSVEVCPLPILIKLKPDPESAKAPLIVGGLNRDPSEMNQPVIVLADATRANQEITLKVDSIMGRVGIKTVELLSTEDPLFREGIHSLAFVPDRDYPSGDYYIKGNTITLHPASSNNYQMRPGYSYTYGIVMQTILGRDTLDGGCEVGTIPFTLSVVPNYLRWDPQDTESNEWNTPGNWIGIDQQNRPIHDNARFAPLNTTAIIIPEITDGRPYPELPDLTAPATYDSVKQVGFQYNKCDYIRFMPGAAMSQQQRMEYSQAIIDMPMPYNEWAFRSAPVKGMISGDLFMANADLHEETSPWEVGPFDATGRTHKTGNASYWLSLYSTTTVRKTKTESEERTDDAAWSKVTNGMTLSLPPAQGFAVYARTTSHDPAAVRLPKNDDIYYYYDTNGNKVEELYEQNLQTLRNSAEYGNGHAGELAFHPSGASESYGLTKGVASKSFVFGNPTMGYIDIWGFIADNTRLKEEIGYMASGSNYTTISKSAAEENPATDVITNQQRYLPPMHAMVITLKDAEADALTLSVTLNTNRVLTSPSKKAARPGMPRRMSGSRYPQAIMTVTATNAASPRCLSRLLVGQGYHDAVYEGEDAVLTTLSIDKYTNNTTPATPFNLYAAEGEYGLCIDLRDSIVNIPLSFYLSDLPFEPTTRLWFTGVNKMSDYLVLYDTISGTERPIADGIYIDIQTPEQSHEVRYYIRRRGYKQQTGSDVTTDFEPAEAKDDEQVVKFIENNHVYILRRGQLYTILGQRVQ